MKEWSDVKWNDSCCLMMPILPMSTMTIAIFQLLSLQWTCLINPAGLFSAASVWNLRKIVTWVFSHDGFCTLAKVIYSPVARMNKGWSTRIRLGDKTSYVRSLFAVSHEKEVSGGSETQIRSMKWRMARRAKTWRTRKVVKKKVS